MAAKPKYTKTRILFDLLRGEEPSVNDLRKKYKLVNPRVQIMRLRADGYPIYTKEEKNTRRYYYDTPPQAVVAQAYYMLGAAPYLEYLSNF